MEVLRAIHYPACFQRENVPESFFSENTKEKCHISTVPQVGILSGSHILQPLQTHQARIPEMNWLL